MKALTFRGRQRIEHESVEDPRIELPGDAVVRVKLAAICGSDLHVYHEREKGLDPGTVMGHEFFGEVVETGSAVRRFRPGDPVFSPFSTSCGSCFYCLKGLTCRCPSGELYGWVEKGSGLQGAQAEYVRVPLADSTLVALPENVLPEEALLLADVLSTAFFCADQAEVAPGAVYAVVGCGPVGLLAVLAARERGARAVFAVDSVAERLARARQLGAAPVDWKREDAVEVLRQATEGRGADGVLELVGSPEASRLALALLRPGGTLAATGVHNEAQFAFSPAETYARNLTYRSGRCPARAYIDRLIPLVQSKKYDFVSIISHRLPLAEGVRGYRVFDSKREGCTKVVLTAS